MDNSTKDQIQTLIDSNPVMVFMKGTKLMPQCGFSNNVVQILNSLGIEFGTFDVLSDFAIREGIKEYSDWPTIPQVYLKGEFLGGSECQNHQEILLLSKLVDLLANLNIL